MVEQLAETYKDEDNWDNDDNYNYNDNNHSNRMIIAIVVNSNSNSIRGSDANHEIISIRLTVTFASLISLSLSSSVRKLENNCFKTLSSLC